MAIDEIDASYIILPIGKTMSMGSIVYVFPYKSLRVVRFNLLFLIINLCFLIFSFVLFVVCVNFANDKAVNVCKSCLPTIIVRMSLYI